MEMGVGGGGGGQEIASKLPKDALREKIDFVSLPLIAFSTGFELLEHAVLV